MNSILHADGSAYDEHLGARNTPIASETATVIFSDHHNRGKSVAFDIKSPSCPSATSSSPNFLLKSILHRHANGTEPKTISTSNINGSDQRIDILNDDWYGRAPLASPETLSEISSISSRTSIALNLATSIENYLHRITANENGTRPTEAEILESQMHTPKVMRRAPKITGNLSKCAEDWQSCEKYKRMGKIFVTNPVPLLNSSSNSSHGSYESTGSLTKSKCCTTNATAKNARSADNIGNVYGSSFAPNKLTWSDSAILDGCLSNCPKCPCKHSGGSLRLSCCPKNDHSWCTSSDEQQNTSSTSDTYGSAVSSLATIDTTQFFNNTTNATRLPSGVLESHFPVYSDSNDSESSSLLPTTTKAKSSPKLFQKTNGNGNGNGNRNRSDMDAGFKRISREYERDRFFVRNDSLPLLASLVERGSPNSFNRRRNHAVYPMSSSPHTTPSKRAESNV